MRKRPSKIFLVIAISSLLLLIPAYLCYANLSKFDFIYPDPNLENDDQFNVQNHGLDGFSSTPSSIKFLPGINPFKQSYHLLSQILFFDQETPILRC